jgi:UDP-N-acetylmuramyl pentapeptide phosphotransferase/UDP-N-acetylglucosamine-1-phosphate transferase
MPFTVTLPEIGGIALFLGVVAASAVFGFLRATPSEQDLLILTEAEMLDPRVAFLFREAEVSHGSSLSEGAQ